MLKCSLQTSLLLNSRLAHENQLLSSELAKTEVDKSSTYETVNKINGHAQESINRLNVEITNLKVGCASSLVVTLWNVHPFPG